jgi:hypothetical protein
MLSDVLVLIAAIAVGLASTRIGLRHLAEGTDQKRYAFRIDQFFCFATPVLLSLSLAIFGLSLRRPRPPLVRLVREPGFAAIGAVTSVFLISGVRQLIEALVQDYDETSVFFYLAAIGRMPADVGLGVCVAWVPLAIGRWRPNRSWTDRFGRAIGFLWIVFLLLHLTGIVITRISDSWHRLA